MKTSSRRLQDQQMFAGLWLNWILCEFWEIFQISFLTEYLGTTASENETCHFLFTFSLFHPTYSEIVIWALLPKIERFLKNFSKPGESAYHGVLKIGFRRSCFRVDFAKCFRTSTLCKIAYNFLFNVLWNCCYLMMSHLKAWSFTFLLLLLISLPPLSRESFDLITVILLTPFIGSVD